MYDLQFMWYFSAIYDLSSKVEFSCQYKVQNLEFTPLSLDYWYVP